MNLETVAAISIVVFVVGCASDRNAPTAPTTADNHPGFVKSEFVGEYSLSPSSHASTIVETRAGFLAAWYGGPYEGHPEVVIWTAQHANGRWMVPTQVADGIHPDGTRYPCWNPVLFQPKDGPLLLFYKVGPTPKAWWGMMMTSSNNGETWSQPRYLRNGLVGAVRNKPVELPDGSLLCGSSTESDGWRVHIERTPDKGETWERTPPLNDGKTLELIQPTILQWPCGRLQILCRSRQGKIFESWMGGDWKTWTSITATMLPNPNSAIDAVILDDGRALLVYNHSATTRSPLNIALSHDGQHWQPTIVLENELGEYSYPAVIQSSDGFVHITYTWNRHRIKHVVIDPTKLQLSDSVTY